MAELAVIILAPLHREAVGIARSLKLQKAAHEGRWCDRSGSIELWRIGPMGRSMPALDPRAKTATVIIAGLAGGLDPSLRTGDVVVDPWPAGLVPGRDMRPGRIHTAEKLLASPAAKAAAFASSGAMVVDLEHASVAALLRDHVARVVGVRCVLDTAADSLPVYLGELVDNHGNSLPRAALGRLLLQPSAAQQLLKLAARSSLAAERLGWCVGQVVRALATGALD